MHLFGKESNDIFILIGDNFTTNKSTTVKSHFPLVCFHLFEFSLAAAEIMRENDCVLKQFHKSCKKWIIWYLLQSGCNVASSRQNVKIRSGGALNGETIASHFSILEEVIYYRSIRIVIWFQWREDGSLIHRLSPKFGLRYEDALEIERHLVGCAGNVQEHNQHFPGAETMLSFVAGTVHRF